MRSLYTTATQITVIIGITVTGIHLLRGQGNDTPQERVEANTEWLHASDLLVSMTNLSYRNTRAQSEWTVGVNHGSIDMDFSSPDIFTTPTTVRENRLGAQTTLEQRLNPTLQGQASLQAYDGFATYAAAWLHEFYRQRYGVFGYDETNPYGVQGSVGLRWEYIPGSAYLQFNVSGLHQRIAPGAEFTGTLTLGNERLETMIYTISSENILSSRWRSRWDASIIDTTDRHTRLSLQAMFNYAITENWVARIQGAYTREPPRFDAYLMALTLERNIGSDLLLSLGGRYYRDTGEIENSLLFSNAAPGIETVQVGLGLRYTRGASSLKVYLAPYATRYENVGPGTEFFGQLYSDRKWFLVQGAFTWEF